MIGPAFGDFKCIHVYVQIDAADFIFKTRRRRSLNQSIA